MWGKIEKLTQMQAIALTFPICIMSLLVLVKCWKPAITIIKKPKIALKSSMGWVILGLFTLVFCVFVHSLFSIIPLSALYLDLGIALWFYRYSVYPNIALEIAECFAILCLVKAFLTSDKVKESAFGHKDINYIFAGSFILGQIFTLVLQGLK